MQLSADRLQALAAAHRTAAHHWTTAAHRPPQARPGQPQGAPRAGATPGRNVATMRAMPPTNTPPPPWTPVHVAELNAEQARAGTEALHCGTPRHEHVPLTATLTGWRCPLGCGYNPSTATADEADVDAEPDQQPAPSPTAAHGRSAQCGEECSEGHVYAGRCAMLTSVNPDHDAPEARLKAAEHLLAELRHLHTRGPGQLRTPAGMLNSDDVCRSCCVQWPCPTGRVLSTRQPAGV